MIGKQDTYTYDFNYSMTFNTQMVLAQPSEKELTLVCCRLIQSRLLIKHEHQKLATLLVRHGVFKKMMCLLKIIAQVKFGLVKKVGTISQLQGHHEQICDCIKKLNILMGGERNKDINVVILILTLVLNRFFLERYCDEQIEEFSIYHLVNWEIRGIHSTNAAYQNLQKETLLKQKVLTFIKGIDPLAESVSIKCFKEVQSAMALRESSTASFSTIINKNNQAIIKQFQPQLNIHIWKKKGEGQENAYFAQTQKFVCPRK